MSSEEKAVEDRVERVKALAEGWKADAPTSSPNPWMQGYQAGVKAAADFVLDEIKA